LAHMAAISAMDAKVSEIRALSVSNTVTKALTPTAENSAADAKAAASVAKSAVEQATALAIQAMASALNLLKQLRDSTLLERVEEIDNGIKELEAIKAITGVKTGIVGGMVLKTEAEAAKAEEAARSAKGAADAAEAASGTVKTAERAAEGQANTAPAKEVTAPLARSYISNCQWGG
jgi:hypothetical protein